MADRRQVITSARRLFAEKGYFSTGTTEIVEVARVGTRGALYAHFPNKKALFLEVLEELETELGEKVGLTLTGGTWRERLEQALAAFLDASLDADVRRILLIDGAVLGWDAWREIEARHGLGAIKLMLDKGNTEGCLRVADTETMSHLLLSVIDEAALLIAHASKPRKARAAVGKSLAALVTGLAAP